MKHSLMKTGLSYAGRPLLSAAFLILGAAGATAQTTLSSDHANYVWQNVFKGTTLEEMNVAEAVESTGENHNSNSPFFENQLQGINSLSTGSTVDNAGSVKTNADKKRVFFLFNQKQGKFLSLGGKYDQAPVLSDVGTPYWMEKVTFNNDRVRYFIHTTQRQATTGGDHSGEFLGITSRPSNSNAQNHLFDFVHDKAAYPSGEGRYKGRQNVVSAYHDDKTDASLYPAGGCSAWVIEPYIDGDGNNLNKMYIEYYADIQSVNLATDCLLGQPEINKLSTGRGISGLTEGKSARMYFDAPATQVYDVHLYYWNPNTDTRRICLQATDQEALINKAPGTFTFNGTTGSNVWYDVSLPYTNSNHKENTNLDAGYVTVPVLMKKGRNYLNLVADKDNDKSVNWEKIVIIPNPHVTEAENTQMVNATWGESHNDKGDKLSGGAGRALNSTAWCSIELNIPENERGQYAVYIFGYQSNSTQNRSFKYSVSANRINSNSAELTYNAVQLYENNKDYSDYFCPVVNVIYFNKDTNGKHYLNMTKNGSGSNTTIDCIAVVKVASESQSSTPENTKTGDIGNTGNNIALPHVTKTVKENDYARQNIDYNPLASGNLTWKTTAATVKYYMAPTVKNDGESEVSVWREDYSKYSTNDAAWNDFYLDTDYSNMNRWMANGTVTTGNTNISVTGDEGWKIITYEDYEEMFDKQAFEAQSTGKTVYMNANYLLRDQNLNRGAKYASSWIWQWGDKKILLRASQSNNATFEAAGAQADFETYDYVAPTGNQVYGTGGSEGTAHNGTGPQSENNNVDGVNQQAQSGKYFHFRGNYVGGELKQKIHITTPGVYEFRCQAMYHGNSNYANTYMFVVKDDGNGNMTVVAKSNETNDEWPTNNNILSQIQSADENDYVKIGKTLRDAANSGSDDYDLITRSLLEPGDYYFGIHLGEPLSSRVTRADADDNLATNFVVADNFRVYFLGLKYFYIGEEQTSFDYLHQTNASEGYMNATCYLHRTLHTNKYNSIILPFNLTKKQMKETFGDNVKLWEFDGTTERATKITFNDVDLTSAADADNVLKAYHLYMIRPTKAPITEETTVNVPGSSSTTPYAFKVKFGSGEEATAAGPYNYRTSNDAADEANAPVLKYDSYYMVKNVNFLNLKPALGNSYEGKQSTTNSYVTSESLSDQYSPSEGHEVSFNKQWSELSSELPDDYIAKGVNLKRIQTKTVGSPKGNTLNYLGSIFCSSDENDFLVKPAAPGTVKDANDNPISNPGSGDDQVKVAWVFYNGDLYGTKKVQVMQGLRCWIEPGTNSSNARYASGVLGIDEDLILGDATTIEENGTLTIDTDPTVTVYGLDGQFVGTMAKSQLGLLAKGVYVVNGRKYIVK